MKKKISFGSFSSLMPSTKKFIDKTNRTAVMLIAIICVLGISTAPITKLEKTLEENQQNMIKLKGDLLNGKSTLKQREQQLNDVQNITSKIIDKDSFITFIGKAANAGGVKINMLSSGESLETDSITSINFKLELSGTMGSIKEIIGAIDKLGATYNIRTISMRKTVKNGNDKREAIQAGESWLKFDKNNKGNLNPANIPLPEALPEVVLNKKGEIVEIKDSRLMGVEELIKDNSINLYLDISFLISR